jgi:hypothetical protein
MPRFVITTSWCWAASIHLKVPVDDIENTTVLLTMLGGEIVWQDPNVPIRPPLVARARSPT